MEEKKETIKERKRVTCPYARFVIHYRDGSTVEENVYDGASWEKMDKRNIIALSIKYDGVPLDAISEKGVPLRLQMPETPILKGSQRYEYQFFQFKRTIKRTADSRGGAGSFFKCFTIGMVVDSEGHCVVTEAYEGFIIRTYYTTLRSLGFVDQLSIDKHGISGTVTQTKNAEGIVIKTEYDIDKCGLLRNTSTVCQACGTDWMIFKDHSQHDCKPLKEIIWQRNQRIKERLEEGYWICIYCKNMNVPESMLCFNCRGPRKPTKLENDEESINT